MKTHHDEKKLETLAEMMHLMKEIHEQRARETDEHIKDIAEKWKRGSEERDVIAEKRYEETLSKLNTLWEGMSVKLVHRLNDFEERLEALERARSAPPPPRGGGGQENDDGDATALGRLLDGVRDAVRVKDDEPPAARRDADLALPELRAQGAAMVAVAPVLGI